MDAKLKGLQIVDRRCTRLFFFCCYLRLSTFRPSTLFLPVFLMKLNCLRFAPAMPVWLRFHLSLWVAKAPTAFLNLETSSPIPRHFCQHHRHATPIRETCKYQTSTHKRAQSIKRWMRPSSKTHAQKHQQARRNSHLTLERNRLCPTHHRQAGALPRHHATIEHRKILASRRLQLLMRLLRTLATAAYQHTTISPTRSGPHRPSVQSIQRHQMRTFDMDFPMLRRRPHIDQGNAFTGIDFGIQLVGLNHRDRNKRHKAETLKCLYEESKPPLLQWQGPLSQRSAPVGRRGPAAPTLAERWLNREWTRSGRVIGYL